MTTELQRYRGTYNVGMSETVGSLRTYFILVGVISCISNVLVILRQPSFGLFTIFALAGVGLAVAYLYIGIQLKELIVRNPAQVTAIVLSGGVFVVIGLIVSIVIRSTFGLAQGIIGLLIVWYLYRNIQRLAIETGR